MEPRVQYAKTSDGVSIAYYATGKGEPLLVFPPLGNSHLSAERRIGTLRNWLEHIAEHRTIIRFDHRNFGMSDRRVKDASFEAVNLDVKAVLDRLGLDQVDVLAGHPSTLFAMSFAETEPAMVRRLLLLDPVLRWMDYFPGPQGEAILKLAETDWNLFIETASHAKLGWSSQESQEVAALWRESVLAEDYVPLIVAWHEIDVSPLLSKIQAETLVVYNASSRWARGYMKAARRIASEVAHAQLMECEDDDPRWYTSRKMLGVIDDFLGIASRSEPASLAGSPPGTAIILFADIVDSTALTERLGDDAFREKARRLDEAMRGAIRDNGGSAVEGKTLGDGVLAVFASAKQAIGCARACHEAASATGLALHAGIHAGDVIREADNVYGGAVNIAARVAAASAAGETLVSATVRELARTSAGVVFEDRGEQALKGIDDPVRVWAVSS